MAGVLMKEIYNVLSAAMGQEKRLAQIANNLANVSTVGFKQDHGVFEDFFKAAETDLPTDPAVVAQTLPDYRGSYTDFTPGGTLQTGAKLDMMIEGQGFFEIEGAGGGSSLFTRAGNFLLNAEGELTTPDGLRVLGDNGSPIRLSPGDENFALGSDGTLQAGSRVIAKLSIVEFEDVNRLSKIGHGLFAAPQDAERVAAPESRVKQGFLESSNVSAIEEMIRMIETQRAFEAQQKAMKSVDDIVGQRIGQILNG
jgi:flagellar basal-body rod protein FlgF